MWVFPYQPEAYSWTKKMNETEYTTIAVDLVDKYNQRSLLQLNVVSEKCTDIQEYDDCNKRINSWL